VCHEGGFMMKTYC